MELLVVALHPTTPDLIFVTNKKKSVIHAVFLRNFCHSLRTFMWRKIEPKSTFVEKK